MLARDTKARPHAAVTKIRPIVKKDKEVVGCSFCALEDDFEEVADIQSSVGNKLDEPWSRDIHCIIKYQLNRCYPKL